MAAAADVRPLKRVHSFEFLPPYMSEFRVVLLGNSWSERSSVGNLILGQPAFDPEEEPDCCVREQGQIKEKDIVLINTPDLIHGDISEDRLTGHVDSCMRLSRPGPHVFLLVLQPEDFTEEQRLRLCRVLQLFNHQSFSQSLLLISAPRKEGPGSPQTLRPDQPLKDMMVMCRYRYLRRENTDLHELLTRLGQTAVESSREHGSSSGLDVADAGLLMKPTSDTEQMKPVLNLVLCGHAAAAGAILGQTDPHPVSSSSQRVKHQVCGRWVSLVELPALSGKPLEDVMKESLRCVSLFDPEGVHAFILVLPVGPLTDEDKREFETIVTTFGSQVKAFTMTLFTVDADPSAPAVINYMKKDKDIQELIQRCGGHFVLNIRDGQQISELLDSLEKHRAETEHEAVSYTTETFAQAQIQKNSIQQAELQSMKQSSSTGGDMKQSPESLRIVLLGKNGCGKSSSGNTILGRKLFQAESGQISVTRFCKKAHGEVNGRPVTVVDTPGLLDTALSHEEVYEEMIKCISLLAPGPHVFLLVVSIGRFTEEEKMTVKRIKEGFGGNVEKFTIVLLTGGDKLKREKMTIDEYIETRCTDSFKKLISDCGGRYHLFDNKDYKNQTQVSELITKIDEMVKENGGSCFTNEMLQEAETAIKKQMEKLLKQKEEEMRKEIEKLKIKHREEMQAMEKKTEEQRKLREKQLEDMKEKINKEKEERERDQKRREEEERSRKELEDIQRQELRQKLADSEKQIQIKSEEKQMTDRELQETREELQRQQDNFEKQLKDWLKDRYRENEQRQHEEQAKLMTLEEEYKREKENDEKKTKEEDKLRQQEEEQWRKAVEDYKRRREEKRAETEKQRKLREKQLEDMKEKIRKEREEQERDQKRREEEERRRKEQEDIQRQELRQKLADSEKQIQIQSEEKQTKIRELQKTRKELQREQDNREKQLNNWWKDRNREKERIRHEEQTKLKKLEEEYKREKENDEKKRKEVDQLQQQEEEQWRKAMEDYERRIEDLKKTYEEEARKKAEEFNDFMEKYKKDYEALQKAHEKEMKKTKMKNLIS